MIKLNGREVEFKTFPNGETHFDQTQLMLRVNEEIASNQKLLFKYENDSDLIKLMLLKNYLDAMLLDNVTMFVAYMPYSRMDRSERYSPFTLKYVANFINQLNFKSVVVIEPHSDVTTALLDRSIAKYINFNLVEKVKEEVDFDEENDYIVFPDNGSAKRYSKMKAKNVIVGHKDRDFQTGEIKGLKLVGDLSAEGDKAIIVDDLSSYGGTFVHTAKALMDEGFEEIYLLVAHAENSIFKKELFKYIDKVFTTNSILTEQDNWENKKFESQLKIYDIEGVLSNE